jgi:gliding motility-associated-like protein
VNATVAGCPGPAGTISVTVFGIPGAPTLASNSPVCDGQTLNLSANTVIGATYSWTGPNSFTSAVQNPSISPVTSASAGTYSVLISVMGCGSAAATITVAISPLPPAPVAGSNSPLCTGSTVSLTASTIAGTTYSWTGPNSFTSTTQNPTIPGATTVAAGVYSVSAVLAGCPGPAGTVTVAVNDIPNTIASSNSTICIGATLNLFATSITGATYSWSGPNSFTAATQNPTLPGATALANGVYSVSANVGGCIGPVSTTSVTVSPPPAAPSVVSNSPLCAGTTLSLSAGTVAGATYTWSGPNTFTSTAQNPTITPITMAGAGVYSVAVVVAGCQGPFGTISVTVNPAPAAPVAGNNSPICISGNLNLTASNIAGATYSWTGPNSFTSTTQNPTIPGATTIAAGAYSVTSTVAGCSSTMAITIATISMPAIVSAADATVCSNNPVVILTGTSSTGSGTWTTSGSGSFAPNSLTGNYTPSAGDISAGTVTLTVTSTNNGACAATSNTMVVTINPGPTANAGIDQTLCANNATVALSGSVSIATGGVWSSNGTGTFVPNNTNLATSYIPSNADTTAGSVTIYLTTTGNGNCFPTIDSMVVTISSAPLVIAGGTVSVCKNNPVAVLNGYSSTGSLTWTPLGTGTLSSTSVTNPTYTPSTADTTAGSVQLILTSLNNGNCNSVSDTVTIVYSSPPSISAGISQTVCANNSAVILNGVSSTSSGTWTTSGSGTFAPNTINGTYNPSLGDIGAGSVTLTVTSTNNGGCNSVTSVMNVSITPAPIANAGSDITVCANTASIALSGTVSVATGGYWSSSGTGTFTPDTTSMANGYIPSTADTTAGSVTIYLTTTGNGNCLQVVDSMVITFNGAPMVDAGNTIYVCKNNPVVPLNAISSVSSVTWTTLGTGVFNPNPNTISPTYFPSMADTTAGNVTLIINGAGSGVCAGVSDTVKIFFQGRPYANFLASSKCLNTATTFTDISTTSSGTVVAWNWNFGVSTSTLQNPSVTFTATGTQTVSLTVSTGCLDSITKTIYINPNPVTSFSFTELCHDSAMFFGSGSVNPGTITGWNWNFGDTTSSTLQNPIHLYPDTGSYIVTLTVMSDSGCVASSLDTINLKKCGSDIVISNPGVPSGFSPNGDGKNDILFVKGGPLEEMNFRIFNEWGNEIFKSTIQTTGWDGTFKSAGQPAGRYIWTLTGKVIDGTTVNMKGEVILSR